MPLTPKDQSEIAARRSINMQTRAMRRAMIADARIEARNSAVQPRPRQLRCAPTPPHTYTHPLTGATYVFRFRRDRVNGYPAVQFSHATSVPHLAGRVIPLRATVRSARALRELVRLARILLAFAEWDTTTTCTYERSARRFHYARSQWRMVNGQPLDPLRTLVDPLALTVHTTTLTPDTLALSTSARAERPLTTIRQLLDEAGDHMEMLAQPRLCPRGKGAVTNPATARAARQLEDAGMGVVVRDPTRNMALDPWRATRRKRLGEALRAAATVRSGADALRSCLTLSAAGLVTGRPTRGLTADEQTLISEVYRAWLEQAQRVVDWVQHERQLLAASVQE